MSSQRQKNCNIRADSRLESGRGHLRRMEVIARALEQRGVQCRFWIEDPSAARIFGDLWDYPCHTVSGLDDPAFIDFPDGTAFYLIDHYGLSDDIHDRATRLAGGQLVDFTSQIRRHRLVIFPGLYAEPSSPVGEILIGSDYYPIAERFSTTELAPDRTRGDRLSVYLTLGGHTPEELYGKMFRALLDVDRPLEVHAVLGATILGPERSKLLGALGERGHVVHCHSQEREPWKIMALCDCAITSAGVTAYELASFGLPSAYVLVAENQRKNVEAFSRNGWGPCLGDLPLARSDALTKATREFLKSRDSLEARTPLIDGRGADRIADRIVQLMEAGQR